MAKDAASGFTLIELIVLVTIIAIIVTVGIPSFNNLLRDTTIRSPMAMPWWAPSIWRVVKRSDAAL